MLVGGSARSAPERRAPDLVDDVAERPRVKLDGRAERDPHVHDAQQRRSGAASDVACARRSRSRSIGRRSSRRSSAAAPCSRPACLPPAHWAYNADVPHYDHDLARAKQLLDEAGSSPTRDGVPRFTSSTRPASDRVPRRDRARDRRAARATPASRSRSARSSSRRSSPTSRRATTRSRRCRRPEITEPDFYYNVLQLARGSPTTKDPDGGNRWRYRNAEVDRLTDAGPPRARPRPSARRSTPRSSASSPRTLPIIPLWHEDNVVAVQRRCAGLHDRPKCPVRRASRRFQVARSEPW